MISIWIFSAIKVIPTLYEKKIAVNLFACVKGGLEAFEENLRREEEAKEEKKRKEEERRLEISQKTRNNLSRLLDRKRAENKDELIR